MPTYDPVAVRSFVVVPAVLSVIVLAWSLWNLDRLPDPMAIHFGLSGEADGYGSPLMFIIVMFALSLGLSLVGLLVSTTKGPVETRRASSGIAVAGSFMIIGMFFSTVLAQFGEHSAEAATVPFGITTGFVIVGFLWSDIMGRRLMTYPIPPAESAPPASAPRGPESAASTVTAGWGMWVMGIVVLAIAVVGLLRFLPLGVFILILLSGSFQLGMRSVVSVTDSAVLVRAGLIKPMNVTINLMTVKSATPKKMSGMDVGGLGIRSDNNGGTMVAPRGGDAVVIETTEQRWTLVVADQEAARSIAGDINSRCDRIHQGAAHTH